LPSQIRQLQQDYGARGLRVVAINVQESYEKADAWRTKENVPFPIVLDPEGATMYAYGVRSTPTVFIIGRDGKIVGAAIGNKPWTSPPGRAVIEAALSRT
jgi:peroxiredoxin